MAKPDQNAAKTISTVMAITLIGKVLGLVRDSMLAMHYGTGMQANAFYTASRIPRVFFDAVFASAIAACFIPVFSEYLTKRGKSEAFSFSSRFLTVIILLSTALCALGMAFTEPMVMLFANGYDAETAALAAELTQIMFPTVIFTGIAFSFVGILQSLDEFKIPALISTISNMAVIAYFIFFNDSFGIYGLAVAFLIGWLLQALIQLPALSRLGYRYRPQLRMRDDGLSKVFALMIPVMVSTWVQPINLTINSRFGSHLYNGAGVSAIEISTNLYLIIAGVFILSITNVIFPTLSRLTAENERDAFWLTIRQTVRGALFVVLPMTAGLMVVAYPLISLIYGGGQFDAFSTQITAEALFWLSLGMVGFTLQNILSRAYFARQQGRVPLIAGGISIAINALLCIWLTDSMGIAGLAIASSVSSTVYGLLLLIPLERQGLHLLSRSTCIAFGQMALSTLLMAVSAWSVLGMTSTLFDGKLGLLFSLGCTAICGGLVYFTAAALLKLDEATLVLTTIKRIVKRG